MTNDWAILGHSGRRLDANHTPLVTHITFVLMPLRVGELRVPHLVLEGLSHDLHVRHTYLHQRIAVYRDSTWKSACSHFTPSVPSTLSLSSNSNM